MSARLGPDHKRLYRIWHGMHDRCENPRADSYPRYGGRGITVCDDWVELEPFKAWALANGYAPELTLDRRDNGKGYELDNCRWATALQQNHNRRNVHRAPDGTAWCAIAQRNGLSRTTFNNRVDRGWSPEIAATTLSLYHPLSAFAADLSADALRSLRAAVAEVQRTDPRSAATLAKIAAQVEGWRAPRLTVTLADVGKVHLREAT